MEQQKTTDFEMSINYRTVGILKSFENQSHLQAYISNIIKLSKMLNIHTYDEINYSCNDFPCTSEILLELPKI